MQNAGYFQPKIELHPQLIRDDQFLKRYSLTVYIEPGRQFRLGEIRFANVDEDRPLAFSAGELRGFFHLRRGDLLNVSKIRDGLNEVSRLYGSKGYIDAVVGPETQNGDDGGPIDFLMKIDEEKQYRVRKIEFLGLTEKSQSELTPKLKPGDIFNKQYVSEILKRNRQILPADASLEDVTISRNTKDGTVDIRFVFFSCPQFAH